MKSLVQQLKQEITERYGLEPEQVQIHLEVNEVTQEQGEIILKEFNKYQCSQKELMGTACGITFGHEFKTVTAYAKKEENQNERETNPLFI